MILPTTLTLTLTTNPTTLTPNPNPLFAGYHQTTFTDMQLRRTTSLQNTTWRRFIVHMCRACMNDEYLHAKHNDKDVSLNNLVQRAGGSMLLAFHQPHGDLL